MFEESMSIPGIWASMNSWFTPTVLFVLLNVMIGTIAVTSGLGAQKHPNQQQQQQQQHEQQDEKTREDSHHQQQQQQQQQHHHQQHQQQQQQQELELNRSPSVLQRLKSINFYAYTYRSQEPISIPTPDTHTREIDHRNHQPEQPHEVEEVHTHEDEEEEEEHGREQEQEVGEGEKTMEEVYCQLQRSHNRTKSETKPASGEVLVKLPRKMRKSASVKSAFSHFEEGDIVESRRPATVREGKVKATAEVYDDDDGNEDDEEVDAKADDFINRFKQQLKLQRLDSIVRYKEMVNRGSGK